MMGVLAIDKPAGKSSRGVVNHVQRAFRPKKIKLGHTGTLDPLATGVLLIAVGQATRLTEFSHLGSKEYIGTFELGKTSDTLDIEGELQPVECPELNLEQLESACQQFQGMIEQVPPKYSAIHIDGRRAYDLAREGKDFDVPKRQVTIHSLAVESLQFPIMKLRIACSTGTYIRTLGSDIAKALGTDAVMTELVRSRVGAISLEQCIELESVQTESDVQNALLSPLTLLDELPQCMLSDKGAGLIRNGIAVGSSHFENPPKGKAERRRNNADLAGSQNRWVAVNSSGKLVAILKPAAQETYRSVRVFQNTNETAQPSSTNTRQSPES